MFDKEKAKSIIIEFMKNNGKTDVINTIEEGNIIILSAKYHYGCPASDTELAPFEKATKELIEVKILISNDSKFNISSKPIKYYLDIQK